MSLDMKLENRLNMKDLDRLQDAFMVSDIDQNSVDGILTK